VRAPHHFCPTAGCGRAAGHRTPRLAQQARQLARRGGRSHRGVVRTRVRHGPRARGLLSPGRVHCRTRAGRGAAQRGERGGAAAREPPPDVRERRRTPQGVRAARGLGRRRARARRGAGAGLRGGVRAPGTGGARRAGRGRRRLSRPRAASAGAARRRRRGGRAADAARPQRGRRGACRPRPRPRPRACACDAARGARQARFHLPAFLRAELALSLDPCGATQDPADAHDPRGNPAGDAARRARAARGRLAVAEACGGQAWLASVLGAVGTGGMGSADKSSGARGKAKKNGRRRKGGERVKAEGAVQE
jgi:hypothetical protein